MKNENVNPSQLPVKERIIKAIHEILPSARQTAIWVIKITCIVSTLIFLLRYFNILPYISEALQPVMNFMGLPGEASLAYVAGYFVNIYSTIAAAETLNLSARSVTILAVLVMCSHNMIVETAVQKKIGSSALRIVLIRTLSGVVLAFLLNMILPQQQENTQQIVQVANPPFWEMFKEWIFSLLLLCLKMLVLIYLLSIIQQVINEFGIIKKISKVMKWPLKIFGLPEKTSFLWIIANTLGLAYGAAVMFQEKEKGNLTQKQIQLLNSHISISHSNLEDLMLFVSIGGVWWIILITRWVGSIVLVWEERLEFWLRDRYKLQQGK